ncbi:MAG: hypothetical protein ACTSX6_10490 [Candidatus Heimdallarchaeaceae archaeon]
MDGKKMKKKKLTIKISVWVLCFFLVMQIFLFSIDTSLFITVNADFSTGTIYKIYTANIEQNIDTLDNDTAREYIDNMTKAGFNLISINNYDEWVSSKTLPRRKLSLYSKTLGWVQFTAEQAWKPVINATLYARSAYNDTDILFYPTIEFSTRLYEDLTLWNVSQLFSYSDYILRWDPMDNLTLHDWKFDYYNGTDYLGFSLPGFSNQTTTDGWWGNGTLIEYNFTNTAKYKEFVLMQAGDAGTNPLNLNLSDYDYMFVRIMTNGTGGNLQFKVVIRSVGNAGTETYNFKLKSVPQYANVYPLWYALGVPLDGVQNPQNVTEISFRIGENDANNPAEHAFFWVDEIYFRKSNLIPQVTNDVHNDNGYVFVSHAWEPTYSRFSYLIDYVDGWGAAIGTATHKPQSLGWDEFEDYNIDTNPYPLGMLDEHGYDFDIAPMSGRSFFAENTKNGEFLYLGYYNAYEDKYYIRTVNEIALPIIAYTNSVLASAEYTLETYTLDLELRKTSGQTITLIIGCQMVGKPKTVTINSVNTTDYSYDSTNKLLTLSFSSQGTNNLTIIFPRPPTTGYVALTDPIADDWLFVGENHHIKAKYVGVDSRIGIAKLKFSDGQTTAILVYDNVKDEFYVEKGDSIVRIYEGEKVEAGYELYVTWGIVLKDSILDATNVKIYSLCYGEDGSTDMVWHGKITFNIYNIGGGAEYLFTGQAGKITGGDWCNVYVKGENDSAYVSLTFKYLQHWHAFLALGHETYENMLDAGWLSNSSTRNIVFYSFGIDFYYDGEWRKGWWCNISYTDSGFDTDNWIEWTIRWYYDGTLIKTDTLISNWDADIAGPYSNSANNNTAFFYIDLWFNKINASSVVGGRVNPEYFGIESSGMWFWADYHPVMSNVTQSMFFHDLIVDGEIISAKKLKLMKLWVKLEKKQGCGDFEVWLIGDVDLSEFKLAKGSMEGVNTPIFTSTKNLDMPVTGFLAPLYSAIITVKESFAHSLTYAALDAWTYFVGFLDTVASFLGFPNAFSNFLSYISTFYTWMTDSFTYLISLLTTAFNFFSATMTKITSLISMVVTQWISLFRTFINFLDGAYAAGIKVYDDLGIKWWIIIGAILYPVYLLILWDEKGLGAVIDHITFLMDIAAFLLNIFISFAQLTINLIGRVIESIPVVE